VIPCVVIGGVAGWLRHRSGGLGAPVLFHGMNNAIAVSLTVLIP
jgi:membrane protease YdiL (CAAX protease family)